MLKFLTRNRAISHSFEALQLVRQRRDDGRVLVLSKIGLGAPKKDGKRSENLCLSFNINYPTKTANVRFELWD
jgi:hypothetical protein